MQCRQEVEDDIIRMDVLLDRILLFSQQVVVLVQILTDHVMIVPHQRQRRLMNLLEEVTEKMMHVRDTVNQMMNLRLNMFLHIEDGDTFTI